MSRDEVASAAAARTRDIHRRVRIAPRQLLRLPPCTGADHARRYAAGHHARWQGTRDHRARSDDRACADIRHHHRGASNPAAGADVDQGPLAFLVADGDGAAPERVRAAAARHMDARPEQRVGSDVREPDVAARPEVGMVVEPSPGRGIVPNSTTAERAQ